MKAKMLSQTLLIFAIIFIKILNVQAQDNQTGSLRGVVADENMKDPLPFANVMIVGTSNGAATDLNGEYLIRNIPVGKQTVEVSYVGYVTKNIDVIIVPNKITELNIALKMTSVEGEEVVITAQRVGQQNAINEQINSNVIKNVVAADRLQENPDANVAEAIGRLPGISLVRSGGEGQGVVIRGLEPKYSKVEIDGIEIPSMDATNRSTKISGISQYVLQGVEVFKTLTPDMDGDATAGVVNLKLSEVPEGPRFNLITQGGYNRLNNYWGNYKLNANLSDRFFNDKFGIMLNIGSERVNRSDQNMTSDYGTVSAVSEFGQYPKLYVNDINLTNNVRINYRSSGTLILDYKYGADSKIVFSNFLSHSSQDFTMALKGFDLHDASRMVTNLFEQSKGSGNELYLSSLKGENKLGFIDLSYGAAFSQTHVYSPGNRSWWFQYAGGVPSAYTDTTNRSLPLGTIVNAINENLSTTAALKKTIITNVAVQSEDNLDRIANLYFNAKLNFQLANDISAYVKFGAKYKIEYKKRYYTKYYEGLSTQSFPQFGDTASKYLSWIDVEGRLVTANGFQDHIENSFLKGQYNFGWYPNFDRLNELMNWYSSWSSYWWAHLNTNSGVSPQMLLRPDFTAQQTNNYKFSDRYFGTYLMIELDLGNMITFIPGVRYEKVIDNLDGWWTINIPFPTAPTGHPASATHEDDYYLPNAHLIVRPIDWMQIHLAYTSSLKRPDFFSLIPITYVNTGSSPNVLSEGNPNLKPEYWNNFDLQFAFFTNKIGYLGINGFYKIANNAIWTPVYVRMPSDPLPAGFENVFQTNAVINITQPVNMHYPVFIKGLEFEWQTNFWYLPKPLSFFSLYVNYTLMSSSTKYPRYTIINERVGTDSRGRPIYKLVTYYYADNGSMVNQPNNITNFSLGFNHNGLNIWLSYEFSGEKLTAFNPGPWFNVNSLSFQRWDLQVTQKLPIQNLEALLNVANINNPTETQKLAGDPRPASQENYGWTVDLGLRYGF